jgi:hypothetical protein
VLLLSYKNQDFNFQITTIDEQHFLRSLFVFSFEIFQVQRCKLDATLRSIKKIETLFSEQK